MRKNAVQLRRVMAMRYGDALPADHRVPGEVPVVSSGGVTGQHDTANTRSPCIVVGRKGSHGSVHWSEGPCFVIDTAYAIDATETHADLRWLYYVLLNANLGELSNDVGVPGLSRESAYETTVPWVPPLEVQRRIADFLDDQTTRIDQIITARQQQIDLMEEGLVSWLSEQYTELAHEWGLADLRYGLRAISQGWSPQCHDAAPGRGEWGVLRAGCVNGGVFRADDLKTLPPETPPQLEYQLNEGDLLVNRASGSLDLIGSCAIARGVRPLTLFCDKLYRLETNGRWEPAFVASMWRAHQIREHIRTGVSGAQGMANSLPSSLIREVRLPDVRVESQAQWLQQYEDQARNTLDAVRLMTSTGGELQELKRSLISAAVAGEFDVSSADGSRVVV